MASPQTYSSSTQEVQALATSATAVVPQQLELSSLTDPSTTLQRKLTRTMDHVRTSPTIATTLSDALLRNRLIADVSIGLSVTAVTAPILTAIDRAIVQRAAGTHTVTESLKETGRQILRRPAQFFASPALGWVYATYAATYVAANVLDTLTDTIPVSSDDNGTTKTAVLLIGTTAANTTASLLKDRAYSRMFGASTTRIPMAAYGFWLARDATVISSSFILPSVVGSFLEASPFQVNPAVLQIATPTLAQVVAGPLHWAGLEVAAASSTVAAAGTTTTVFSWQTARTVGSIISLRMARILPGYGITGCGNKSLRQWYKEHEQDFLTGDALLWPLQRFSSFMPKQQTDLA